MPKIISATFEGHLALEVTTLATCWRITRRDGVAYHFTDHDRDLAVEGATYTAATGYTRTAVANNASLAVDNLDVEGMLDSDAISEADLRAGRFDHAEIKMFAVNWADLSQGKLMLRSGWLGEVRVTRGGTFVAELRGLAQALQQRIGELYSPECRTDLGDAHCKVPLWPDLTQRTTAYAVGDTAAAETGTGTESQKREGVIYECTTAGTTGASEPPWDTTVGNTTADGTVVWTARAAWFASGAVTMLTDRRQFATDLSGFADGWFDGGLLVWETGDNAGIAQEVKTQTAGDVALFLPMPYAIQIGDVFRVFPGCDKRLETCRTRFANVLNFRGEPHVPGNDAVLRYATYAD